MNGWHHRLDGRESEWTLGVGDGQGGLVCCNSWGRNELDTTEWLNYTELKLGWGVVKCIIQCLNLSGQRRRWHPTPGLLPGKSHGRRSLAAVHGVTKSQTRLSDFTFTFHLHALEKEMATHSSILACRIPGREETCGLLSMGSHRVRHDWSDLAAAVAARVFLVKLHLNCWIW